MRVNKGDEIRLVKPMGYFTNVGEVCDVVNVTETGDIEFKFANGSGSKVHKGVMSADEADKYFEKVESAKTYNAGDSLKMIKTAEGLKPMEVGDEFIFEELTPYGVASIISKVKKIKYFIAKEVLEEYFEVFNPEQTKLNDKVTMVTPERIEEVMNHSKVAVTTLFDKCTVVACQLPNGFVIVESSACVSPENYDEKIGIEICMNRIKDKVWELEGYKLQEELYCNKEYTNNQNDDNDDNFDWIDKL